MKIRALAVIAALAIPVIGLAAPQGDTKPSGDKSGSQTDTANDQNKAADRSKTAKLADDDVMIISHQHHVNQMEIEMGKLAKQAGGPAVKRYGNTLVTDHTALDKDLTAFAKQHGLSTIPPEKPANEIARQNMKETMDEAARIKQLKGPEFDRQFVSMMLTGHEKEVGRIEVDLVGVRDPTFRELLNTVKPVLQRHAEIARRLQQGEPTASAGRDKTTPPGSGANPPSSVHAK
jgi:putative membrane protein